MSCLAVLVPYDPIWCSVDGHPSIKTIAASEEIWKIWCISPDRSDSWEDKRWRMYIYRRWTVDSGCSAVAGGLRWLYFTILQVTRVVGSQALSYHTSQCRGPQTLVSCEKPTQQSSNWLKILTLSKCCHFIINIKNTTSSIGNVHSQLPPPIDIFNQRKHQPNTLCCPRHFFTVVFLRWEICFTNITSIFIFCLNSGL